MTRLQEWLLLGCRTLGIDIELDFIISLKGEKKIKTIARIPSLGGNDGMLIVKSSNEFWDIWDDPIKKTYGIAVLDEPSNNAEFNLAVCKEMFMDWGWDGLAREEGRSSP